MIKVIIIEDDPMLAEIHNRFIKNIDGYKVINIFYDGLKAFEFLKKREIDLIILDIYLPKIDGITLMQNIREEKIKTDIILITAAKESNQINIALKYGVIDYLVKPFEFDRFRESLEYYLNRKKLLEQGQDVNQSDIDQIIRGRTEQEHVILPKGLHKKTLSRISQYLNNHSEQILDVEKISGDMQLSKVTARRYLEYFEEIGKIEIIVHYGSRGRPSFKYKIKK